VVIIYLLYQNQFPYKGRLTFNTILQAKKVNDYWIYLIRDFRSNYLFFGNNTTLEHCFALG